MINQYAPVIVFAFNRVDAIENCIASLLKNEEAKETELYIFVDGPRKDKKNEEILVEQVRDFVRKIKGFKNVHYTFSKENKGLATSVISGVTDVMNIHSRVIVVEDDLIVSENFLAFMNQGLNRYENNKNVFSVCGYTNIVKIPKDYSCDAYFCVRSSSWGWATWKDRWDSVDWDLKDWSLHKKNARKFNKWGGSDCWKMLNDWRNGRNSSWAIRFCYTQFLQDSLSLFPLVSKVGNEGFDGRGTHGKKWTRARFEFDNTTIKTFKLPNKVTMNHCLYKEAMSYHTILIRIWSKIMYLIH